MKKNIILLLFILCFSSTQKVFADTEYPIEIWEGELNGRKQVIKTYELKKGESPESIAKKSFDYENFTYEYVETVKNESVSTDVKEVTKEYKTETKSKEKETILGLLPETQEYKKEGYSGILYLDESSIVIENAGTKTREYTIEETRTFENLSANDASLLPKRIHVDGKELSLNSVTWKTSDKTVDYQSIPSSYTAAAIYTGKGYKTVVTDYLVKATYKGSVSKINKGNDIYTVRFIGTEIQPVISTIPELTEELKEGTEEVPVVIEEKESKEKSSDLNMVIVVILLVTVIATAGCITLLILLQKEKKKGKEIVKNEDTM